VNKIAEFRDLAGLSQQSLAEQVGITRPYLSKIEHGKQKPAYIIALKIAKVLDRKVEEIFFEDNVNHGERNSF